MARVTWAPEVKSDFGAASDWFGDTATGQSDDAILLARSGGAYTLAGAAIEAANRIAAVANATPMIAGHPAAPSFIAASGGAGGGFITAATAADAFHAAPAPPPAAAPVGFNLNVATGQNSSGVIQTTADQGDVNWTVTNADHYLNPPVAYTVAPGVTDWFTTWMANGPNSSWIAADPNTTANGNMTFTLTFNLTGFNPADATLVGGRFMIDDAGAVYLNGIQLGSVGFNGWESGFTALSSGAGDFVAGVNTLVIQGTSSDNFYEAARLEGTIVDTTPSGPPGPLHWASAVSGDFATGANWTGGVAPGLDNDAIIDATGASYTVTSSASQSVQSLQTVTSATLDITGGAFTVSGGTGSGANAGTVQVEDGASLAITGAVDNSGAIQLLSVSNPTEIQLQGNGSFSGGGQVSLASASGDAITGQTATDLLTNVDNTIAGAGLIDGLTLVNDVAGVIQASGGVLTINTAGQTLTNDGLLEAVPGGTLEIVSTTVDQSGGGLIGGKGALAELRGADVIGGTLDGVTVVGSGNVLDGSSAAVTLAGPLVVMNGASVTLEGSIVNTALIAMDAANRSTDVVVGAGGVSLGGGGQLSLRSSHAVVEGAEAGATLTNLGDRIEGGGLLGGGQMILVNDASGVIIANLASASLTVDTGAVAVQNAGWMGAVSVGDLVVASAIDNTGLLVAAKGGSMTVDGDVTGTGSARVNGGTLTFVGAFDQNVRFGPSGELVLAHSASYGATISGFAHTGATSLDLQDVSFAGSGEATFSGTSTGGVLTVVGANQTVHINLEGDYLGATFTAVSDGGSGSLITDPLTHANRAEIAAPAAEWKLTGASDHPADAHDAVPTPHPDVSMAIGDWLVGGMHMQVATFGAEWLFH